MDGNRENEPLRYRARIKYSEDSIRRLCRTQYDVYSAGIRFLVGAASIVLICIAFSAQTYQAVKLLCLVVGCLAVAFMGYPPQYRAKSMIAGMKGVFPETTYNFRDGDILLQSGGQERSMSYDDIERIICDEEYIYLFVSRSAAYMIDKARMKPKDPTGLTAFLAERTGLRPGRRPNLMSLNLKGLASSLGRKKRGT